MAVKTITIDLKAYELLAREKQGDESFSRVIRRRLRPEKTARRLVAHLAEVSLGEDALQRTEELVAGRRRSPAKSPALRRRGR